MTMFSLMVFMRDRENAVALWFKSSAAAIAARDRIVEVRETIDDFGHHFRLEGPCSGFLISDLEREQECQTELALSNARAQASANTKAATDPRLKFAMNAGRPPGLMG